MVMRTLIYTLLQIITYLISEVDNFTILVDISRYLPNNIYNIVIIIH